MTLLKYTPDYSGLREIGQSTGMAAAVMDAARAGADAAQQLDPQGSYVVSAVRLRAGTKDEIRVGAMISDESSGFVRTMAVAALTTAAVNAIER